LIAVNDRFNRTILKIHYIQESLIMLGRPILAPGTIADDRTFVYEVEGLQQNAQTENSIPAIRNSGTTMIQVPFSRMGEFMQRMNRVSGRIVAIHTSTAAALAADGE
jgi:phycocyanin-associated, rod